MIYIYIYIAANDAVLLESTFFLYSMKNCIYLFIFFTHISLSMQYTDKFVISTLTLINFVWIVKKIKIIICFK